MMVSLFFVFVHCIILKASTDEVSRIANFVFIIDCLFFLRNVYRLKKFEKVIGEKVFFMRFKRTLFFVIVLYK